MKRHRTSGFPLTGRKLPPIPEAWDEFKLASRFHKWPHEVRALPQGERNQLLTLISIEAEYEA